MVCPMSALPTALQAALPATLTRSPNPNPNPTQPPPRPDSAMTLLPLPVASLRLTEAEAMQKTLLAGREVRATPCVALAASLKGLLKGSLEEPLRGP